MRQSIQRGGQEHDDNMIEPQILRKTARYWNLKVDAVEKHYVLGWILYGISKSSIGNSLAFKGGTALSKIYFPSDWRLSEDLDFTLLDDGTDWDRIIDALSDEVPKIIQKECGMTVSLRNNPHTNPQYLQAKMKYTGPIGPGTIKVEITKERFVGNVITKAVPQEFDYPKFSVKVYGLETLVSEKIRAILERGYVRDYYDVWRMLKEKKFDHAKARKMFYEKCSAKGVKFAGLSQFFPQDIIGILSPHLETGLVRLSREPLLPLQTILSELEQSLKDFLK